jgi:hypothetical protein
MYTTQTLSFLHIIATEAEQWGLTPQQISVFELVAADC